MTTQSPATHRIDDNRPPLAIREIRVLRAPGIASAFTLNDLSPDITIVYGPNASGKSTTARAIQTVLWPHASALRGHHLAATFALGEDEWNIDASAGNVKRTRNGEPSEAPLIAPLDDRSRYSLGLPDLLASENQPLAHAILNESSGGFDLPKVAESLGFNDIIPPRLNSARAVQAASAEMNSVISAGKEAQSALGERSRLQARREESLRAEQDITAIDKALAYRRTLIDEVEATGEIEQFSPEVRAFTGDEPAEINRLGAEIDLQEQKRVDVQKQRDRWQQLAEHTGLDQIDSPEDSLKALRTIGNQRAEISTILNTLEGDLAAAVSERRSHQHRLADDMDDDQIAALDANGIRELAEIAKTYETIRSRRTARDEVEHWLGGVSAPENLPILQQGVETLQTRLQHPSAEEHRQQTGMARWIGMGSGILLAGAGAYLALEIDPLWWVLAVIGIVLAFLAWRFTTSNSPKIAASLERQYAELNLPQPTEWRGDSINHLLGQLRDELKVALVEQEKADRWHDLEQERAELDTAHADNELRREQAIAKFGVAPDLKEESLRLLAENLGRWQAADAAVRGLEGRRTKLQADDEALTKRSESKLTEIGLKNESGDLSRAIEDLERRLENLNQAATARDGYQQELKDKILPTLAGLTANRDGVYQRFNLEPGDAAGLQNLQASRSALLTAKERLQQYKESTRVAWEALSLTPAWREQNVNSLTAARMTAQDSADSRPEIEAQL